MSATIIHLPAINPARPFKALIPGDFFKFNGGLFVKTERRALILESVKTNVTGFPAHPYGLSNFDEDTLVFPVSARIEVQS